jgi:DNA-binding SARP family transcriptional activator
MASEMSRPTIAGGTADPRAHGALLRMVQDCQRILHGLEDMVIAAESSGTQPLPAAAQKARAGSSDGVGSGRGAAKECSVKVSVLGPLEVKVCGQPMLEDHWRAAHAGPMNARALFAFLIHRRETPMTRDEIADAVWPFREQGLPSIFSRTLSGLRLAFRQAGLPVDPVTSYGGRYVLNSAVDWRVDAERVMELFDRAEARRTRLGLDKAVPLYREVMASLRGTYMEGIDSGGQGGSGTADATWWQGKRGRFEDVRRQSSVRLATHWMNQGQADLALSLWEQEVDRPLLDTHLVDELAPLAARAYLASDSSGVGLAVMKRLNQRLVGEEEDEVPGLAKATAILRRPTGRPK